MRGLIDGYTVVGHQLAGAAVVVGSLADPEGIANEHIRIHALEGRLFRTVVIEAAVAGGLTCSIWRERDLYAVAAESLERPEPDLRGVVAAFGRTVDGAWRAEQKAAALAAWLVLASRGRAARTFHAT